MKVLFSPPAEEDPTLREGSNSIPDSEEWSGEAGGTVLPGGLQFIRSGVLVRGPPRLYIV